MKKLLPVINKITILFVIILLASTGFAQQKTEYKNLMEALISTAKLAGKSGPRNVNWIDNGNKYSYTQFNAASKKNEIRSFDPETGKDELIFNGDGLTFPDTNKAFEYQSFQWAHDSKHLLFQSNFRRLYRRSGISDYFVYSLDDKILKTAAKNARTAELSPDGSYFGEEIP